jgi:predicted acetyltransferase
MGQKVRYARGTKLKFVSADEIKRCEEIGGRAFRQHTVGWYPEKRSVCLENRDGKLVACLLLTPMPGWWGKAEVPMCAVGNVATDPAEQRRGYAGALMVESVHMMREEGYAVCPLWPFSFRYYGKFGWALGGLDLQIKVPPSQLWQMGVPNRVRRAREKDLDAVRAVYRRFAQRHNACSVRPKNWWRTKPRNFPEGYLVHKDVDGRIDGYLLYRFRHRHDEDGKLALIAELVGSEVTVQGNLAAAIPGLPEVTMADILLPADSCLPFLAEERIEIKTVQRLQIRVIDPVRALCRLQPSRNLRGSLTFLVDDWVIDTSKPVLASVDVEDGTVCERKRKGRSGIRCDINTFSQIFIGALSASRARELGRLEAPRARDLELADRLLFGRVPFRSHEEAG